MKRKMILCTIALSTLLFSGCTQKNVNGAETSPTPASATTAPADTNTAPSNAVTDGNTAQETAKPQSNTSTNTGDETTMISEEEAKKIALNHAGLTTQEVTFIKSGLDRDDGRLNYDVEFYTQDKKEYDYEIDPYTGEVLDHDYDAEYYTSSTDTHKGDSLSADDAKKIALDKVPGATAQDIKEFKSDYDNGRLQYEGKIYYEEKEYEFELDGYTGAILEWDVENIYGGVA